MEFIYELEANIINMWAMVVAMIRLVIVSSFIIGAMYCFRETLRLFIEWIINSINGLLGRGNKGL